MACNVVSSIAPSRETHIAREMARLNAAIEAAEKAQIEQEECLSPVLSQERTLCEMAEAAPEERLAPMAVTIGSFADRVQGLAERLHSVRQRVEL